MRRRLFILDQAGYFTTHKELHSRANLGKIYQNMTLSKKTYLFSLQWLNAAITSTRRQCKLLKLYLEVSKPPVFKKWFVLTTVGYPTPRGSGLLALLAVVKGLCLEYDTVYPFILSILSN